MKKKLTGSQDSPAPDSNPAKAGRARQHANLRKGSKGSTTADRPLSLREEMFCIYYKAFANKELGAARAGFAPYAGYKLARLPRVKRRLEQISEESVRELIEEAKEEFRMSLGFLKTHLTRIIAMEKPHPYRGYADQVKALETGLKAMKVIEPARVTNSATAGAAAQAAIGGQTMEAIYKSKWLAQKEAQLAEKFEQEHKALLPANP